MERETALESCNTERPESTKDNGKAMLGVVVEWNDIQTETDTKESSWMESRTVKEYIPGQIVKYMKENGLMA